MAQCQIFFMTGSWGPDPDLLFETLKSKFYFNFWEFLAKIERKCQFSSNLQELLCSEVSLPYSEHFLFKNFSSSCEFSIF